MTVVVDNVAADGVLFPNWRSLKHILGGDMAEQQGKTKGVADIVFLIDATASMTDLIDGLKDNLKGFIDFLSSGGDNQMVPVRDWRGRAIGFRDFSVDGSDWFEAYPFVTDAEELKRQIDRLEARGGGDAPESLLDAIFKIATMGEAESDPAVWRPRSEAVRVVVVFSDAPFHTTMKIPEAAGGVVEDVHNACNQNGVLLSIFGPPDAEYENLAHMNGAEYTPVEGEGLVELTGDTAHFRETLEQLAKSISASTQVVLTA